jgi:Zn-dependent peptidase ImmA (M78 family)
MIAERFDTAVQLGFAPEVAPLLRETISSGYLDTADRWAQAALAKLSGPIRNLDTVDLLKVLEHQFGINAIVEELPEGIDGLSFAKGDVRIVIVRSTDRTGRQRFTIAHELAHVLFGDGGEEVIEEQLFTANTGFIEPRANAFAASFLMPSNEIDEVLSGRDPVESFNELVWAFRVSPHAMAWRLKNLNKLDQEDCLRLVEKTLSAVASELGNSEEHGIRIRESSMVRPAGRLSGAYISAFLTGEVAAAPVAEVSGLSVDAVYRMREELTLPDEWPELFGSGE